MTSKIKSGIAVAGGVSVLGILFLLNLPAFAQESVGSQSSSVNALRASSLKSSEAELNSTSASASSIKSSDAAANPAQIDSPVNPPANDTAASPAQTDSGQALSEPPLVGASSGAAPDSGRSTLGLPDILKEKTFAPDTAITDLRMRADAGSLSRYSVKANFDYSGSTINDFSNPNQPNPDHTVGLHRTKASGQIGTRYRFDSDQAMSFGTGATVQTPTYGINRVDVNNPYLSYDLTKKLGPFQTRISPSATLVTSPESRNVGQVATGGFGGGAVYNLGLSRWAVSADANISYGFYNRPYRTTDLRSSSLDFGLYPGIKYNATDNLSIAASLSFGYMSPKMYQRLSALDPRTVGARVGIGWAIKRDIYIYPFLTLYPTQLEEESTSFNVSTVFSIL